MPAMLQFTWVPASPNGMPGDPIRAATVNGPQKAAIHRRLESIAAAALGPRHAHWVCDQMLMRLSDPIAEDELRSLARGVIETWSEERFAGCEIPLAIIISIGTDELEVAARAWRVAGRSAMLGKTGVVVAEDVELAGEFGVPYTAAAVAHITKDVLDNRPAVSIVRAEIELTSGAPSALPAVEATLTSELFRRLPGCAVRLSDGHYVVVVPDTRPEAEAFATHLKNVVETPAVHVIYGVERWDDETHEAIAVLRTSVSDG
jgi:hypothetical protein